MVDKFEITSPLLTSACRTASFTPSAGFAVYKRHCLFILCDYPCLVNLPKDARNIIRSFIRIRVGEAERDGVVIGLSGGVDSATVLELVTDALGNDNVIGMIMPDGKTDSTIMALEHAKSLKVETEIININTIVSNFTRQTDLFNDKVELGNLKARIRMSLLYAKSNGTRKLVVGTSNKSELLIGYYTKWGDGGSDFLPIGDLYKTQVYQLARELRVPEQIVKRTPTAELWKGQTDEEEIGMEYEELDKILICLERKLDEETIVKKTGIGTKQIRQIKSMIKGTVHKRIFPPVCKIGLRTVGIDWREVIGIA